MGEGRVGTEMSKKCLGNSYHALEELDSFHPSVVSTGPAAGTTDKAVLLAQLKVLYLSFMVTFYVCRYYAAILLD